ncbi:hypothetical protein FQR65_LT07131 [Abscondita terminalis]|nr:hypothetical protein FQR65_LT07131 [Abscondita terminalis]
MGKTTTFIERCDPKTTKMFQKCSICPYMTNTSREGNLQQNSEIQHFELNLEATEFDHENLQEINIQHQAENEEDESQPQTLSGIFSSTLSTTRRSIATPAKKLKKDNVTTETRGEG